MQINQSRPHPSFFGLGDILQNFLRSDYDPNLGIHVTKN